MKLGPTVMVSGYYGFANTGDEAILATIVQELGVGCDLVVLSADPASTRAEFGVRAIGRTAFGTIWRELTDSKLFISGGGGLLQDATSLRSVPYYSGLLKAAAIRRVPTMLLGAGVGPLDSPLSRMLAAPVLQSCRVCAVRDEGSARLLGRLGVEPTRIKVTADPVLLLRPATDEQLQSKLADHNFPSEPTIAVAIRPWQSWYERQFKSFSSTLAQVARQLGVRLLLMPFQRPGDERITRELGDCLQFRPDDSAPVASICETSLSPSEVLNLLGKCDLVVAMRLHALIMAAAAGIPFLGIAYDPKVLQFCASMEMPVLPSVEALEDANRLQQMLLDLWQRRLALRMRLNSHLPGWKSRAQENFALARATIASGAK